MEIQSQGTEVFKPKGNENEVYHRIKSQMGKCASEMVLFMQVSTLDNSRLQRISIFKSKIDSSLIVTIVLPPSTLPSMGLQ